MCLNRKVVLGSTHSVHLLGIELVPTEVSLRIVTFRGLVM